MTNFELTTQFYIYPNSVDYELDEKPDPYTMYKYASNQTASNFNHLMKLVLCTNIHRVAYDMIKDIDLDQFYHKNSKGYTAFGIACINANSCSTLKTVKLLLKICPNINVNHRDKYNRNVLHNVCSNILSAGLDVVKLLLENNAQVNYEILRDICCKEKLYEIPSLVENVSLITDWRFNLLKIFINNIKMNGKSINDFCSIDGDNLLHISCMIAKDNYDIIKLLIDTNIDINHKNNKDETPLHYLCRNNNPLSIFNLLLEHGANVNAQTYDKSTPLHYLCEYLCDDVIPIKLLVDANADINATDFKNRTPLHSVCISRNITRYDKIKTMLELNADPNIVNYYNNVPLNLIFDENITYLLINNGADIMNALKLHPSNQYLNNIVINTQNKIKKAVS